MEIIPFGEVVKERFDEAKKYKLIENVRGIWRVTEKCKKNYEPTSYIKYLQGKIKEEDVIKVKLLKREVKRKKEDIKYNDKKEIISDLLGL